MPNRHTSIFVVVLLVIGLQASTCLGQKSKLDVVDETGKVFGGLAELTLARDRVMKRCAMLITAEFHGENDLNKPPMTFPVCHTQLHLAKPRFEYLAQGVLSDVGSVEFRPGSQRWDEMVRCDGKLLVRSRYVNTTMKPYTEKPSGVRESTFLLNEGFFPPRFNAFNNIMLIADYMFFYGMPDGYNFETIFLNEADFVSSRVLVGQNVESVWRFEKGDANFDIYVVHSATCDYLPIEVKYRPHLKVGIQTFSDMRVDWVKQNGEWVPSRLNAASARFRKDGTVLPYQKLLSFKWKVGDEAVDELFQCKSEDYRIPIMEQFGVVFTHVRNGVRIPGQYVRPENLEFETPSLIDR